MNVNISNINLSKARGTIPCLRFTRPNGIRKTEPVSVTGLTVLSWQWLQARSGQKIRLTAEDLGNGNTALCIEHADKGDMDIKLVPTKHASFIPAKFSEMIAVMYHDQWCDELRAVAVSEFNFTLENAAALDTEKLWTMYGVQCRTPKEALQENLAAQSHGN